MMLAQKVVAVLGRTPTEEEEEEVINSVVEQMDPGLMLVDWTVVEELPGNMNIGFLDQMHAAKRDAGPEAVYIILVFVGDGDE